MLGRSRQGGEAGHDTRHSDRRAAEEKAARDAAQAKRDAKNQKVRETRAWNRAAKK